MSDENRNAIDVSVPMSGGLQSRASGSFNIDDLLAYVDPAPDEETERFVAAIYEDRRAAGTATPRA